MHDYRPSIIKDAPIQGKQTFLHYKNIVIIVTIVINNTLRNSHNVQSIAKQLGISPSTIFRRLQDVLFSKPKILPHVLSIDEFKGNACGEKFQGIITDAKNRKTKDILPSRTQHKLTEYLRPFKNRKDVRYFITDMNYVYRDIAKTMLPNATIVIDRFHVVQYVTWALENMHKCV